MRSGFRSGKHSAISFPIVDLGWQEKLAAIGCLVFLLSPSPAVILLLFQYIYMVYYSQFLKNWLKEADYICRILNALTFFN